MYWVHIRAFTTSYKLSTTVVSRTVGQNQFYNASIKRLTLSLFQSKFFYLVNYLGKLHSRTVRVFKMYLKCNMLLPILSCILSVLISDAELRVPLKMLSY